MSSRSNVAVGPVRITPLSLCLREQISPQAMVCTAGVYTADVKVRSWQVDFSPLHSDVQRVSGLSFRMFQSWCAIQIAPSGFAYVCLIWEIASYSMTFVRFGRRICPYLSNRFHTLSIPCQFFVISCHAANVFASQHVRFVRVDFRRFRPFSTQVLEELRETRAEVPKTVRNLEAKRSKDQNDRRCLIFEYIWYVEYLFNVVCISLSLTIGDSPSCFFMFLFEAAFHKSKRVNKLFWFPLGREVDFTPIMRALQVWASKMVKDLIILIICV